jgi:hypothetical protein
MPILLAERIGHECPWSYQPSALRQEIGDGQHYGGRGYTYDDSGQNVEGEVDAEVDAGEYDEQSCQHQHGGERRVEDGEGNGPRGRRRRMPRGEGAR